MDRIKQNFRLRSGRSTRLKKNDQNGSVRIDGPWDESPRPVTARADGVPYDITSLEQDLDNSLNLPIMLDAKRDPNTSALSFNSTAPLPALLSSEQEANGISQAPLRKNSPSLPQKRSLQFASLPAEPRIKITDAGDSSSDDKTYNLKAPPPRTHRNLMETLSDMLFSEEHLETILHDSKLFSHFTAFLNTYRPHTAPILIRYLETAKAMKAVQYANAIAASLSPVAGERASHVPLIAATVDPEFEEKNKSCFKTLHGELLPAFITYRLVKLVTELLIKEMTGAQIPLLREMVAGLTEVFCITDPNLPDNPIIFASAEFYRMTGYEPDFVIGKNCRFLQGHQKTQPSVMRIRHALREGQEISEVLLNYNKDGKPFLNCLNIAPLLDDKGQVKYFIGAQVDVSGLVEGGRSLESLQGLLTNQHLCSHLNQGDEVNGDLHLNGRVTLTKELLHHNALALQCLKELSEMFDLEESAIVQTHSRSNSFTKDSDDPMFTFHKDRTGGSSNIRRRVIIDRSLHHTESEDDLSCTTTSSDHNDISQCFTKLSPSGQSGQLPGIYQSYFLVRPAPSLRIVFVSPSLHYLGKNLLQSRFLSHISAPNSTLAGLKEAFMAGAPVTAKVSWHKRKNTPESNNQPHGHTKWLSATPLFGSNDTIGVWMIIVVDRHNQRSNRDSTDRSSNVGTSISRNHHSHLDLLSNGSRLRTASVAPSSAEGNTRTYSLDRHTTANTRSSTTAAPSAAPSSPLPPVTHNATNPRTVETPSPTPPTSQKSPLRQNPPSHAYRTSRRQQRTHNIPHQQQNPRNNAVTNLPNGRSSRSSSHHPPPDGPAPPPPSAAAASLTRETLETAAAIAAAAATSSNPNHSTYSYRPPHRHHCHATPVSGSSSAIGEDLVDDHSDNSDADGDAQEPQPEDGDEEAVIRHVTRVERLHNPAAGRERVVLRDGAGNPFDEEDEEDGNEED